MKRRLFDTYIFEGRIELADCAKEIYKKTGIRTILENPGEIVNGFLNGYYKEVNGKEYTVIDLFVYEENLDIEGKGDKHEIRHKLRAKKGLDKNKIKIKKIVHNKFGKEPKKSVRMNILERLGNYEKK